jgi:hypothetical protein
MKQNWKNNLAVCVAFTACVLDSSAQRAGEHGGAGKSVESQVERDWADSRWNQTVVGPFLASNLKTPAGTIAKALSIRVGNNGEATVCYDTARPAFRGAWTGGFLKFDGRRFGLLYAPAAQGEWAFALSSSAGWENTAARHEALHPGGHRVVLDTRVDGTLVRESPWFETVNGLGVFSRTFEIAPGAQALRQVIGSDPNGQVILITKGQSSGTGLKKNGKFTAFALAGTSGAVLATSGKEILLTFPPRTETMRVKLLMWSSDKDKVSEFEKAVLSFPAAESVTDIAKPIPGRWQPAITNTGHVGFPSDGFAVDTITVPYANPWKALMFCSGVDFFSDGSAAVSTIHGDVWRVSGIDDKLRAVVWRRFATGLFQPLGLRVVNDRAYVLGRDQITVLHDEDNDGVADRYENFCNLLETSTGGHDYVACLERDAAGKFLLR